MPTGLMIWNIQTFTLNKINAIADDLIWRVLPGGQRFDTVRPKKQKLDYIVNTVHRADPSIFVIIEVISSQGNKGSLVQGLGAQGCIGMIKALQKFLNPNWRLVPPLKLVDKIQVNEIKPGVLALIKENSYTEGVAVFYRADRLDFIGPYVWPAGGDNAGPTKRAVANTPGQQTENYPDPWQQFLPADNHFAGQYLYPSAEEGEFFFPDKGARAPFLTSFRETGNGANRKITVVSVHTPPQEQPATQALSKLSRYLTQNYQQAADEVVAIAGDYNVNSLNGIQNKAPFSLMKWDGFETMFDQTDGPTLFMPSDEATTTAYKRSLGLDNVATRYGADTQRPSPVRLAVIDRVATRPWGTRMFQTLEFMGKNIQDQEQRDNYFREVFNFGHIGPNPGTSDHLPLFIQL